MKCSLGISNFLDEISSLSHSVLFLYFYFSLFPNHTRTTALSKSVRSTHFSPTTLMCLCHSFKLQFNAFATLKPYSQKTSQSNHTRTTALSNSMKLSHACRATQDGQVMVERSKNVLHWIREWQTLCYSCLENPMNSMKRQNDRILKEELPKSVGAQYPPGDEWRNNSRKNEGM